MVRVLSNLRTSWITTVMASGGATIAQLFWMVELMDPGRIPIVMILVGTNNISRSSDGEEALWESMMVCLFTTLWQKFNCAVLTVFTVPMSTRTLTATGRRRNEGVIWWNNILRNLWFIRYMIEQISVPALNTCVKMLREGDERVKALLLLAMLDMHQSKPRRVNMN